MLDIYSYLEPQTFLHDAWTEKKSRNASFSMRAWAKKLGFKNNAALSLMLAGKRPIPKKYVPQFSEDLGLGPKESLYLDALVDFHNARAPKEKEFCLKRLRSIAPHKAIAYIELEHFKFLGDPIHMCILEMMDLKEFKPEAHWIQQRLLFRADCERIESAIDRLTVLGLVEQGPRGTLVKKQRHITNKPDVIDQGAREYHRNVAVLAADAISSQSVDAREFNSYAMNIRREDLPRAKQMIRKFAMEFIKEVEAEPRSAQDTFQLNIQLFGLAQLGAE